MENETGNTVTPSITKLSATKVKFVGLTGWGANRDGTEQPKLSATKSFSKIQQEVAGKRKKNKKKTFFDFFRQIFLL